MAIALGFFMLIILVWLAMMVWTRCYIFSRKSDEANLLDITRSQCDEPKYLRRSSALPSHVHFQLGLETVYFFMQQFPASRPDRFTYQRLQSLYAIQCFGDIDFYSAKGSRNASYFRFDLFRAPYPPKRIRVHFLKLIRPIMFRKKCGRPAFMCPCAGTKFAGLSSGLSRLFRRLMPTMSMSMISWDSQCGPFWFFEVLYLCKALGL